MAPSSSSSPVAASLTPRRSLQSLLESARPFLRGELESVSPSLPHLVSVLRSVGAGECWHKHGSFLSHLLDVFRVLHLWSAPPAVSLCGLFHSAYSNSYVNLAIFDPSASRTDVSRLIGPEAERLVHLFCVVNRQALIYDVLLSRYPSNAELADHLRRASEVSLAVDPDEPWRVKINSVLPPDGIVVEHIKTGEDVRLSRRVVAAFLLTTMVDFSDQLFGWQDSLFENADGKLEFRGNNPTALWPGNGKPGLWMSSISRMGAIYSLIAREEEIYIKMEEETERKTESHTRRDDDIDLVIPPVFEKCTRILDHEEQIAARDLYWEAVSGDGWPAEKAEGLLKGSIEKNPFVGEPHMVLAQVYLSGRRFAEAEAEAEEGLRLMLEWGSSWDSRMAWEGWVAWGRVLLMKAKEKDWPETAWGILNLGLVK